MVIFSIVFIVFGLRTGFQAQGTGLQVFVYSGLLTVDKFGARENFWRRAGLSRAAKSRRLASGDRIRVVVEGKLAQIFSNIDL